MQTLIGLVGQGRVPDPPHLKYSCCLWPHGTGRLEDAEAAMLALTYARAGLADRQEILELGCGWGALSLWVAENYPGSHSGDEWFVSHYLMEKPVGEQV